MGDFGYNSVGAKPLPHLRRKFEELLGVIHNLFTRSLVIRPSGVEGNFRILDGTRKMTAPL